MRAARYLASLPERLVRSVAAVVGGTVHETAQLLLPRLIRRSRLYEVSAKNLLLERRRHGGRPRHAGGARPRPVTVVLIRPH